MNKITNYISEILIGMCVIMFTILLIAFGAFIYGIMDAKDKVVNCSNDNKKIEVYVDENMLLDVNYEKLITKDKIIIFLRSTDNGK